MTFLRLTAIAAILLAGLQLAAPGDGTVHDIEQAYRGPPALWPLPDLHVDARFREMTGLSPSPPLSKSESNWSNLGRALFHDPALSLSGDIACSTCHNRAHGWGDGLPVSLGHDGRPNRRNAPALYSSAGRYSFSWDGAHADLNTQVLAPLTHPDEMGNDTIDAMLERLKKDDAYARLFSDLVDQRQVGSDELAMALTAFLATLDEPTRFDRFSAGDVTALSGSEIRGLHLFRTKAGCANCHSGPQFTDELFHNLKISSFGEPREDLGRFSITNDPKDVGAFRTPSLRHVSRTGPYMHNGLFPSLEGVVRLYMRGGGEVWARNEEEAAHPLYKFAASPSPLLQPFQLNDDEFEDLVEFLSAI